MPKGRPFAENPRKEVLQIRLTKEEKEELFKNARCYSMDVAEYIRYITGISKEGKKN